MSIFSEKLSQYMKKGSFNILTLAEQSGFSVALLSKIKTGSRLSNDEEKMAALIRALRITPAQQEDLMREYRIEKIGRERYRAFQAVRTMLTRLSAPDNLETMQTAEVACADLRRQVAEGRNAVNDLCEFVIDKELQESGERRLRILMPPTFHYIHDYLMVASWRRQNTELVIEHIFEMTSALISESECRNLEQIGAALQLLGACGAYRPYYYYSDDSHCQPYPYAIVTSRYALFVSQDGMRAVLTKEQAFVDAYAREYELIRRKCSPLVDVFSFEEEYLTRLSERLRTKRDAVAVALQPCLTRCVPGEMMGRHLRLPQQPGEVEQRYLDSFFKGKAKDTSVFCEEGVRNFLQTGRVWEVPEALYTPLSRAEALEVLHRWIADLEAGRTSAYLLKEPSWQLTAYLGVALIRGIVYFYHRLPGRRFICYRLMEESAAAVMADYLRYLIDGEETYSAEETLLRVKAIVQREAAQAE